MTLTIYVVIHPGGVYEIFDSRDRAETMANPLVGGKPLHPKPLEVIEYVAVPKAADFYAKQNGEKR